VGRPGEGGGRELALLSRLPGGEPALLGATGLAGDDEWRSLIASAHDDLLRVECGDARLEAPRGELREGRLALMGAGEARFRALRVAGLDIHEFTFFASRFRSFAEHIASHDGRPRTLLPDMMGQGSTTDTVAGLWGRTRNEIGAAMQRGGAPGARQAMFRDWIGRLGLPLIQEVPHLHVSRVVVGGDTHAFLLESPEPLDFTGDVTTALRQRVQAAGGGDQAILPSLGELLDEASDGRLGLARRTPASHRRLLERPTVTSELDAALASSAPVAGRALSSPVGLMTVGRRDGVLDVCLGEQAAGLRPGDRVEVFEIDGPQLRRWAGRAARRSGGGLRVRAEEEQVRSLPTTTLDLPLDRLDGVVVAVDPARGVVIDGLLPHWEWQDVAVRVLQDETALRALLIPVDAAGDAIALAGARYRLEFVLDRPRWSTTDPPDADNRYRDEAAITLAG
jgi:hypothetical protein